MENSFSLKISDKKGGHHNYVHLYKANYMAILTVWFYIGYTEGLFGGVEGWREEGVFNSKCAEKANVQNNDLHSVSPF